MEKNTNNTVDSFLEKKITRKEAIQKTGITALTAASLMFLSTNASAANSTSAKNPGNRYGEGQGHGRDHKK